MCIEFYVPDHPIRILFENEVIQFTEIESFTAYYTILLQNDGKRQIDSLFLLYPRSLYEWGEHLAEWRLSNISDETESIPQRIRGAEKGTNSLIVHQPDPMKPWEDRVLSGAWLPSRAQEPCSPATMPGDVVDILHYNKITFCVVHLKSSLKPGDRRWFSWGVRVPACSLSIRTPLGKKVYYRFASPFDVHHTVKEVLETNIVQCDQAGPWKVNGESDSLAGLLRELLDKRLQLNRPRQVCIDYYELVIELFDTKTRCVLERIVEGRLLMKAKSPWFAEPMQKQIFEWKSGQIVYPNAQDPDRFVLHVTLLEK